MKAEDMTMKVDKIVINDEIYEFGNQKKHLKGYIYDSLVYRYIRARENMAEWEWERDSRDHSSKHDRYWYFQQANRDIARFCEILHEAIGEHD